MKTLRRQRSGKESISDEMQGFQSALDKSYARFREAARAEWQRRQAGTDPSDACVHVHIGQSGQHPLAH